MAIQSNFPAIKPSLLLDFANTKQLDPRITFTRASTATFYNGVTTAMAEQNLLTYSQEFDNAAWTKFNSTITANTVVAPDGTTTAETLTANSSTSGHNTGQLITLTSGTTYTASVYAKKNTLDYINVFVINTSSSAVFASAAFNLNTGVVASSNANGTGFAVVSSSITSVGNGWYRCVLVATYGSSGSSPAVGFALNNDGTTPNGESGGKSFAGTGTESVYIWGAQLEQRSAVTAYTATTTQAITNYIPVLQTAASGVPRFDHNPTTGESLGLLIEESRTNICLYSGDYTNAAWQIFNASKQTLANVAPDGTLTACKIVVNTTATTNHGIFQQLTPASTGVCAMSIYVKAAGYNFACLRISADSDAKRYAIVVNLLTGEVTATDTLSATNTSYAVQSVGNGWYRLSVTATQSSGYAYITATPSPTAVPTFTNSLPTFTGDGFSGIFVWGGQIEFGAFATSYIPTVASAVSRATDAAIMTGTNFSSWFNAAEGTLFTNFKTVASTNFPQVATMSDGTTINSISIDAQTGLRAFVTTNGANPAFFSASNSGGNNLVSFGYKVNDFGASFNGATSVVDTSGNLPIVFQMGIGQLYSGSNLLNGTIKKISYYPFKATSAQLQALTS